VPAESSSRGMARNRTGAVFLPVDPDGNRMLLVQRDG
jgi:hypothetical protein